MASILTDEDFKYLGIAENTSTYSLDPSTKVGAVVVSDHGLYRAGFNRFPRGVKNFGERWERPTKYDYVVHAEIDALLSFPTSFDVFGSTLYINRFPPCNECSKVIIHSGIKKIICLNQGFSPQSQVKNNTGLKMIDEAGIPLIIVPTEELVAWEEKLRNLP